MLFLLKQLLHLYMFTMNLDVWGVGDAVISPKSKKVMVTGHLVEACLRVSIVNHRYEAKMQ